MLSIAFRRQSLATVSRLVVRTISSAAMGNKPSVGRKGTKSDTITITQPETQKEKKRPMGTGGGGREGEGTQSTEAKRQGYEGNDFTETSASTSASSVTEMPLAAPLQGPFDQGEPFSPLSLSNLRRCSVFFQLIQRLVTLPDTKWRDRVVSACSIQDCCNNYFFSDAYTGRLVQPQSLCCSPMQQSQTTVNFLLYNPSQMTFPLNLTVFSLNFSHFKNWALTVDTSHPNDDGMYDVTFKSCDICQTDFPKLSCTLTPAQDSFTVSQTVDEQQYYFIVTEDTILGQRCQVIKAVRDKPDSAAQLTFKTPIQFCSMELEDS